MGARSLGLGVLLGAWALAAGCSDDGAASAVVSDDVALPACGALPATALRKVADGVSRAAYGRCGHLAYVESGQSKAVHLLDPALERDTVVGSTDGLLQFSPLGSRLFFHEQGGQRRLVVVDVDALGSSTFDVEDALYGFVSLESAPGGEQMWRCSASQGLVLVDGAGETTVLDGEAGACLLVEETAASSGLVYIDGQRRLKTVDARGEQPPRTLATIPASRDDFYVQYGVHVSGDGQMVVLQWSTEFNCAESCDNEGFVRAFRTDSGQEILRDERRSFGGGGGAYAFVRLAGQGVTPTRGALIEWADGDGFMVIGQDFEVRSVPSLDPFYFFEDGKTVVGLEQDAVNVVDLSPGPLQLLTDSALGGEVLAFESGGRQLLAALDARGRLSTWVDGQRNAIDGLNPEADHVARIWPDGSALVFESLDEPLRRTPQNARFRLLGADGAVKASLEADRFQTVTIVGQEGAVVAFEREGFEVMEGESTVSVRLVALEHIATDGGTVSPIAQRAVSRSLMTGPAQRVLFRADEDGDEVVGLWAGDLP